MDKTLTLTENELNLVLLVFQCDMGAFGLNGKQQAAARSIVKKTRKAAGRAWPVQS